MSRRIRKNEIRLNCAHISMEAFDNPSQMRSDARAIFERALDQDQKWVTGTEGGANPLLSILRDVGDPLGFRTYKASGQDTWVTIHKNFMAGPAHIDFQRVVKADGHWPFKHTAKGVMVTTFPSTIGRRIAIQTSHFITHGDPTRAQLQVGNFAKDNAKIEDIMGRNARILGQGKNLVFAGADTNINDRLDGLKRRAPMLSLADELEAWQNTGHGPIDAIMSFNGDTQVRGASFKVLNDKELHLHTDHWYCEGSFFVQAVAA